MEEQWRKERGTEGKKKRRERESKREKYRAGDVTAGYFRQFLTTSKRKRTVEGDKTETEGDLGRKRQRVSEEREGKMGRKGRQKKNCRG